MSDSEDNQQPTKDNTPGGTPNRAGPIVLPAVRVVTSSTSTLTSAAFYFIGVFGMKTSIFPSPLPLTSVRLIEGPVQNGYERETTFGYKQPSLDETH